MGRAGKENEIEFLLHKFLRFQYISWNLKNMESRKFKQVITISNKLMYKK